MGIRIHQRLFIIAPALALCITLAVDTCAAQAVTQSEPNYERVIAGLKDGNASTRRETANQLGALRARSSVRPLIEALKDKDAGVREAAAFALGMIASPTAVEALTRVLADKDADTR